MRVLLTGAAGFVGAHLASGLLADGAEVHALVRPGSDAARLTPVRDRLSVREVDLRHADAIAGAVRLVEPEVVVHAAAAHRDASGPEAEDAFAVNVRAVASLLEATASVPYHRFVVLGSSTEYGACREPMRESDPPRPVYAHGVTKAAATLLARQFAFTTGKPVVVLRPFNVYGPGDHAARFLPTAIRAALSGDPLPLTRRGLARDWIYVEDVVAACRAAIARPLAPGEIVNVGSGVETTNEHVVRTVEQVVGRPVRVAPGAHPARPWDAERWVADTSKSRELLGWSPRVTFREGVERTVAWCRERATS